MKQKPTNSTTVTTAEYAGVTTDMRVIVPLQGVVQGRGGLVLGSIIPCALFYFFQLYLKRNNTSSGDSTTAEPPHPPEISPPAGGLQMTHSIRSPRRTAGQAQVSSRANSVIKQPDSLYTVGLKRASEDPYDESSNPDGIIQLGLAENKLSLDLIQDWFVENTQSSIFGQDSCINGITTYQPLDGLKMAVAGFMSRAMDGCVFFDPSRIVLTAGATSGVEMLTLCLADPGNAFLVPSPYDPDLDLYIKWRTGVEFIPVPCRSSDNFSVNTTSLGRAYNTAKKRGLKVCGIIISNSFCRESLYNILNFATKKNIHIISNELLACSSHDKSQQDLVKIIDSEEYDRNRVHIVYDLSKDISVPGFRVGVVYSFNENVLDASKKLARFSPVSCLTQRVLRSMLTDSRFLEKFIKINRKRLEIKYDSFAGGLRNLGIKCVNGGGLFCWVDFSDFIRPYSEKGELELWEKLLTLVKVNITPGSSCHCVEPGWFRFCFTNLNENEIRLVIERIRTCLSSELPN